MGQSEQNWGILRPDEQSEQKLTFWANACCSPNILGGNFEILSIHISQIFRNFHLASPPIFRGPETRPSAAAAPISNEMTRDCGPLRCVTWLCARSSISSAIQLLTPTCLERLAVGSLLASTDTGRLDRTTLGSDTGFYVGSKLTGVGTCINPKRSIRVTLLPGAITSTWVA